MDQHSAMPEGAGRGQLEFELLLSGILARFLSMMPRDADAEADRALKQIGEFFEADLCGLFDVNPEANEVFLSHIAAAEGAPVLPPKLNYAPRSPWRFPKLIRGESILIDSLDELPPEAEVDRRSSESLGIKAFLSIPVQIEGTTRYLLHIAFTRTAPGGLADYVPRLRVLAELLATGIERSRAVDAREDADTRLALAAGLAGTGLWDLDLNTGVFWMTSRTRELYGFGEAEQISLERVFATVHTDDAPDLRLLVEKAMQSRTPLQTEYRVVLPGGEVRWIAANGARSSESYRGGNHFLGASIDITERKHSEEAARHSLEEIRKLKDQLEVEAQYLRKEAGLSQTHKEITGKSDAIRTVLHQVEQVAPTESTVLIVGETGTGKELVARAIHSSSRRKDRLMVKVDCASLPTGLIESELFGRERGAYTGALTKQIGRFQLADKGTIFLDEVGELPRETQAKLLRVIQEGSFEPLGSPRTIKVDVRIIAATNRDLAKEVREGRFREDLYYRLNVFPIQVPPLRDRKEDIPMLVWSFISLFSGEMRKDIRKVSKETMDALVRYDWPGNVRELRNLIEQAFIVSPGDLLMARIPQSVIETAKPSQELEDVERQHILSVLEQTRWKVRGANGAASKLGMNPSTLYSRMKKLGIPPRRSDGDMST